MSEPKAPTVNDWLAELNALPDNTRKPWTAAEDTILCHGWGVKDKDSLLSFMEDRFGRDAGQVNNRVQRLRRLKKLTGRYIGERGS